MRRIILLSLLALAGCGPYTYTYDRSPSGTLLVRTDDPLDKNVFGSAEFAWKGVSISAADIRELQLSYRLKDDTLSGTYRLASGAGGKFSATLERGQLTGTVESASCTYSFSGSLEPERLFGEGKPEACPEGASFVWDLRPGL